MLILKFCLITNNAKQKFFLYVCAIVCTVAVLWFSLWKTRGDYFGLSFITQLLDGFLFPVPFAFVAVEVFVTFNGIFTFYIYLTFIASS